jgi:prolyl-tRNA editing enzyme YbaK/EbsC (Cys-tRNA(Pro) deacylase)
MANLQRPVPDPGRCRSWHTAVVEHESTANDAVLEAAEATGVAFEVVACDPDLADTAAFCEAYGYSLDQSANAIVVVGKSEPRVYATCLVLASTRLDVNGAVRRRFGVKKASFASGDETTAITGMQIGGVTPYGLPAHLPIWIDAAVMACDRVIVGGGSRDRKLLVPPASLLALPHAEVVDDLAKAIDAS